MFRKALRLTAAAAAATLLAGSVLAGPKPAQHEISHQISTSDPLHAAAVRSHRGTLVGVAADSRVRSFLDQNGILH